jgi:thiol-disulfide isomerase/thioredoxin
MTNRAVSLAALHGHPVIVNFWATWCGPCVAETPLLQAIYTAHRADGLSIIGVDAQEPLADLAAWKSRFGVTYDLVTDSTGQINALYRVRGLPSSFFIARDGTIQQIVYGPLTAEVLQTEVPKMLR